MTESNAELETRGGTRRAIRDFMAPGFRQRWAPTLMSGDAVVAAIFATYVIEGLLNEEFGVAHWVALGISLLACLLWLGCAWWTVGTRVGYVLTFEPGNAPATRRDRHNAATAHMLAACRSQIDILLPLTNLSDLADQAQLVSDLSQSVLGTSSDSRGRPASIYRVAVHADTALASVVGASLAKLRAHGNRIELIHTSTSAQDGTGGPTGPYVAVQIPLVSAPRPADLRVDDRDVDESAGRVDIVVWTRTDLSTEGVNQDMLPMLEKHWEQESKPRSLTYLTCPVLPIKHPGASAHVLAIKDEITLRAQLPGVSEARLFLRTTDCVVVALAACLDLGVGKSLSVTRFVGGAYEVHRL